MLPKKQAGGARRPRRSTIIPFPVTVAMQQRLHRNNRRHDPRIAILDIIAGDAVATVDFGPANALWVRDPEIANVAAQRWDDLPIRVLGDLYLVADNG